ncbi:YitT family protein [Paenisporosarcina sp. TG20]|uniref:YitT family protein n=1 Tax=Paenisporosarcina sp. TG20 TaxID=1211706 RepID=UPI00059397BF
MLLSFIHKSIAILIGSILMAFGVNVFLVNHQLLDGGSFGMGLIVHYLSGIQLGLIVMLIGFPILILAWFYNRSFVYNSIHAMLFSSFMIDVTYQPFIELGFILNQSPIVSSILGGLFVGSGIGLMLRFDTSIGGTDLFGQIVANYAKINPGIIIFIFDFVIVLSGYFLIVGNSFLLSCITVICVGIMTSFLSIKSKNTKSQVVSFEVYL